MNDQQLIDMISEENRHNSFNNFPVDNIDEIVDNGFYYYDTDMIKCAFCQLAIPIATLSSIKRSHQDIMPGCIINRVTRDYSSSIPIIGTLINTYYNPSIEQSFRDVITDIEDSLERDILGPSDDWIDESTADYHRECITMPTDTIIPIDKLSSIQDSHDIPNSQECLLCLKNKKDILFLPCKHLQTCLSCTKEIENKKCCVCRESITHIVQVYN